MRIKKLLRKSIKLRQAIRNWRLKHIQPRWQKILARDRDYWNNKKAQKKGKNILIATSVGAYLPGVITESMLAAALEIRGANVHILLCDGMLDACLDCGYKITETDWTLAEFGPQKNLCGNCCVHTAKMLSALGVTVYRYSDWLTKDDILRADRLAVEVPFEQIAHFTLEGIAIGEHAYSGALRFYSKGSIDDEPLAEKIVRRYFRAAVITACVMQNLLRAQTYHAAVFHHGIYVPQGIIGEVCRNNRIPVINWNVAYRKSCFIFSHTDTYHHSLMLEPTQNWEHLPWNTTLDSALDNYLQSRWKGSQDWIWFHERPQFDKDKIASTTGIDFSRPCIGMLTNVMWDAQLHYPANAFPNMREWVLRTIEYFSTRPELQLIIRIHPAEIWGGNPSRQKIADEIKKVYDTLPSNIFVILPEADVSTYVLMKQCNAIIIYGTKMGVELASMGKPVIVAGEAWIRNKNITMDALNAEHYFALLDTLPLKNCFSQNAIERARKYAFHFFFRRMIPLEFMKPIKGWPLFKLDLKSIRQLEQGNSLGLDIICNGILDGKEFIYPYETTIDKNSL
ncbi:capsule biosynthesis protein [bacterium]|nr:capsule biosynthesis protein [bacterium]MCP5462055.1 capsule biosynthesis protein [bacterium]